MVSYRRGEKEIPFWCLFAEANSYFILPKCVIYPWRVTDILEKHNLFSLLVFPGLLSYDLDENIESIILLYFQM